jgi:Protein of unknown function (DUF2637)
MDAGSDSLAPARRPTRQVDLTSGHADDAGPLIASLGIRSDRGHPSRWLAVSMFALAVLAAAAAAVSYSAQYRMVYAAKTSAPAAALEAGIPDVAALIFAALGIALALHGRRAVRPRFLNVCAVATSVAMNVLAAGHGWRDLAIWAMPPVAYALASDTAIGVVRAWTIARQRALNEALAEDETTPLAIVGGLLLWSLRLSLAPGSTLAGFRRWVVEECPVAPGRRTSSLTTAIATEITSTPRPAIADRTPALARVSKTRATVGSTKTERFLALVIDRYGPLAQFPVANVSRVCKELAPEVDLDPGAARTALRRHVLAAQNGGPS